MTPPQPGLAAPPLTRLAEWHFLRFVRQTFGFAEESYRRDAQTIDLPFSGLAGEGRDRPLFAWLSPVLVRGTMQWLSRRGGYRRRDVVVKGRLRNGRIWDDPVWGTEVLRIGAPTVAWLAAVEQLVHRDLPGFNASLAVAEATVALGGSAALAAGDRLALSAAFDLLVASPASTDLAGEIVAPRATSLPLFLLLRPRFVPADGPLAFSFGDDLEALALQYLDESIARAWVSEIQRVRARGTTEERVAAFQHLSRLLAALFAASPGGAGDHFLSPVARFYPMLWRDLRGASGVAEYAASVARTNAERESCERALGEVLAFGPLLDARVEQIVGTPWADRTEAQKRLASEHESRYRGIRDEVRSLARRLRREIG